jgi:hypothetical protein
MGILCRTENIQSKLQFFPCARQHASVDRCDDIPGPCLHIFKSCNLGSINLKASGPSLPSQRFGMLHPDSHGQSYPNVAGHHPAGRLPWVGDPSLEALQTAEACPDMRLSRCIIVITVGPLHICP